jgi:hypothetical protein
MTDPTTPESTLEAPQPPETAVDETSATPAEPPPSYVKLAMRNMVRKGGKSLVHFGLTTVGLIGLLIGLSYLTR